MDSGTKKVIIITASVVAVAGISYLAWKKWGNSGKIFGTGRVDATAKRTRTFNISK